MRNQSPAAEGETEKDCLAEQGSYNCNDHPQLSLPPLTGKELLMSGTIGTVKAITFDWHLDRIHGADYFEDGIAIKVILVDWLCTRLLTILI